MSFVAQESYKLLSNYNIRLLLICTCILYSIQFQCSFDTHIFQQQLIQFFSVQPTSTLFKMCKADVLHLDSAQLISFCHDYHKSQNADHIFTNVYSFLHYSYYTIIIIIISLLHLSLIHIFSHFQNTKQKNWKVKTEEINIICTLLNS